MQKEINKILGERMSKQRYSLHMTREKLAESVGVSPRFLADVEAGKVGVALQTLKNIAFTLQVSADYLLGIADEADANQEAFLINKVKRLEKRHMGIASAMLDEIKKL